MKVRASSIKISDKLFAVLGRQHEDQESGKDIEFP